MRVKTSVFGRPSVKRSLRNAEDKILHNLRLGIIDGARLVETEAKNSIQRGTKSGRLYQKYSPRRQHRASAPGEAPATDLGHLVANISTTVDADGLGASVESRAAYSSHLEFGTINMAPRPFMHPAFQLHRHEIARNLKRLTNQAIRRLRKIGKPKS